ncbi:ATP-grasp domain-containing protein [Streptomyces puniciscabiei]|uniref:ATP-grasp domain-containing protein n=1 Tax=Streptomyces puniciscabiei TaxID=164348 RepID=UPI00331F3A28
MAILHRPHGAAGLREIFAASRGLCEPHLVLRQEVAERDPEILRTASSLFPVSVCAGDDVTSAVRELSAEGLVTFHDAELEHVDAALAALGLPGRSLVDDAWDKLVQRRAFASAGCSAIRAVPVDRPEDLRNAIARIGLPAVLKPRRAAGGGGVAFVGTEADVQYQLDNRARWTGLLLETRIPPAAHPSGVGWLGDFVSVETASAGTDRRHLAVFDKAPVSIVARAGHDGADAVDVTGDVTPSRLPAPAYRAVLDATSAALDALGVRDRVTHTELRVGAEGVEVIEVNGRVGGHLARVLRLVGGPDLIRHALTVALGAPPTPVPETAPGYAMGLFVPFSDRTGPVLSSVSRADLRVLPGVVGVDEVARPGADRQDTSGRVANLTLRAPDADTLDRYVRDVSSGLADLFEADGMRDDPWLSHLAGRPLEDRRPRHAG